MNNQSIFVTLSGIELVFREWWRRYQEEPERFMSEIPESPEEYGRIATEYFLEILKEVQDE